MESFIHTYTYENGEIQKVQEVILDSFDELKILRPPYNRKAFDNLCKLYREFIIKKYKAVFGYIILFTLDGDVSIPFDYEDKVFGKLYSDYAAVSIGFKKNTYVRKGKLCFKDKKTEEFFNYLKDRKLLECVKGDRNSIAFMPVGKDMGFLSECKGKLKVNSSFFVFDRFDCATVYDLVGTGIGLNIKDGIIHNPAMFNREALLIKKNNETEIRNVSIKDMIVVIDKTEYKDGVNCRFISRPQYRRSIKGGIDIVIVSNKVVAVKRNGHAPVPAGGYIVHLESKEKTEINDINVSYKGFEDIRFALQVSNSAVRDSVKTDGFISEFSNIFKFWKPTFPPSMYPLNYEKDRAPRIVFGVNKDKKPVILWFEGAGKFGYEIGKESCGASLKEVAEISCKLNLVNAINLDGGGSAQIMIDNKRKLKLSDRDSISFEENERAVSFGLYI